MKYIFITILFISQLTSYEVEINSIFGKDGRLGKIESGDNLKVGTSGIVIKELPNGSKTIIAYAELIENDEVKLYEFETLKQDNLPKGLWKPQVGDVIRFKENYDRALVIAKNFNSFVQIRKKFDKSWIHPDIFVATLSSIGHKTPLKNDFHYFCREHSIGLIYIEFKDEVKKIDCLSLKEIDSSPMKFDSVDIQKPFYSRIKEIDSNWIGEGVNEVLDFEDYYINLIK